MNLHNGHKVVPITDEDSLKKENIEIQSSTKEFNDNIQKISELKKKIENEVLEIDKLYEKVDNEVTQSFIAKYEKLKKEENDLKEKLKTEVTKVKEKLEKFLSEANRLIKMSEKINKGVKNFENEEKKLIKTLTYVSKINKNQKEMNKLFQELMENLKISFEDEENKCNIKYEKYIFNGIPIPKDIEVKDITSSGFELFWKIEEVNILGVNKDEIKFKVELKKENDNEKFVQVYEGKNKNCSVENLDKNTNYEIKICSVYNNINSSWTNIKKVKTSDFCSIILNETKKENEFIQKLLEWSGYNKIELLFRGTRDGMNSNSFHNKCDDKGPTISLFKSDKGYIFGGYTPISWSVNGGYKTDNNSFLFTLKNVYNSAPTKLGNSKSISIYCGSGYGPTFGGGHDIYIPSDFLNGSPYANFPYSYTDSLGYGKAIFTGDNNQGFKLQEIEVFKLLK